MKFMDAIYNGKQTNNLVDGQSNLGAEIIKDITIGYNQKKVFNNKVIIEGRIDVDNGGLFFKDCEIIFKQYGYIKSNDGSVEFNNCIITVDRDYYNNGKIIYLEGNSKGEIRDTEINVLKQKSPGIGVQSSALTIINSKFIGFYAEDPGAVIYAKDSDLEIKKSSFSSCKSTRSGGAILFYADSEVSKLEIHECFFTDCFSHVKGGAISTGYNPKLFTTTYSNITITQSTFEKCQATDFGGAIYLNYDPTSSIIHSIDNCLFNECSVGYKKGGGIFDESHKVEVVNCCFNNCRPDNFRNKDGSGNLAKCIVGALAIGATIFTGGAAGLIIGGAGAVLTAAGNAVNEDYKDELHRINEETQNIINKTKRSYEEKSKNTKELVDRFVSCKKGVYKESIVRFANTFGKIKNMELRPASFDEKMVSQVAEYVKSVEKVDVNSALSNITNVAVAASALLFGGAGAGIAAFGASFAEGMMLSYKIDEARAKYQEVKLKCEEIKVKELILDKILLKVKELEQVLYAVNSRFMLAISEMENNAAIYGYDYSAYPKNVKEQLMVTAQLSQVCRGLLDAKLFGEDGALDQRLEGLLDSTRKAVEKVEMVSRGINGGR